MTVLKATELVISSFSPLSLREEKPLKKTESLEMEGQTRIEENEVCRKEIRAVVKC